LKHFNNMERLLNNNHDEIDIPASIIVDLILPFVDRKTWNNLILTNREIYKASKQIEPPWPRGKFSLDERTQVLGMTFSSDGKYFIFYTAGSRIHVWHKRIGPYAVPTNRPANQHLQITSMASSPTENLLVMASRYEFGAVLQFWDIASLSVVNGALIPNAMATLDSCVFSPDGRLVACNDIFSNSLYIYSASNAVCIKTIVTNGLVALCGFSPDSETIVAGFHDRFIRVWDVAGGDDDTAFGDISPWLPEMLFTPHGRLPSSPQGQSLIIGTANANVCKLAQYQNATWVVKDLHMAMEVKGLYFIFSPAGRLFAARETDGILALCDPVAGKLVQTLGECQHLSLLAFSGNGRMLAVAEDCHVSLWPVGI
jgi:WD40 repeat protein